MNMSEFKKFSLTYIFIYFASFCEMVVNSICFLVPWRSCSVANRKSKL
uniref:Uncharacterized protein n=1 Tax=Arundo donax TaxID=35708 RepID=A0A0A9EVX6_ARUDO